MSWDRTRQVLGQKLKKGRDKARIARDRPGFTEKAEKLDKSEKGKNSSGIALGFMGIAF